MKTANLKQQMLGEVEKQLARISFEHYLTYVHRGRYIHADHTKYIADRLEKLLTQTNQRIIIEVPPRHSKSMTVSESFPSYYLMKNPEKRVILVAYGADLAEDFSRKNRSKVEEYGSELFGIGLSETKATADNWNLTNDVGGLISAGVGGTITGKGADLMIIDDPIKNMAEALSETFRKKLWTEWQATLSTRLQRGANVIVIQTRWHEDDLSGRLINTGNWEVIRLPAICDDETDPINRKIGQALWPQGGYDEEWAVDKKVEVGTKTWNALYQQTPTPDDGQVFKRQWFKFYRRKDKPEFKKQLQSWDATFDKSDTSDYVVGQEWGIVDANAYLSRQFRDKMTFTETVASAVNMATTNRKARPIYIEKKANGAAIIDVLKQKIPGVKPINPTESKEARAQAITPFFEAGNIYFPHPDEEPWVEDLITELLAFPNGKHDDQVDALTQALSQIYLKKSKINTGTAPLIF